MPDDALKLLPILPIGQPIFRQFINPVLAIINHQLTRILPVADYVLVPPVHSRQYHPQRLDPGEPGTPRFPNDDFGGRVCKQSVLVGEDGTKH